MACLVFLAHLPLLRVEEQSIPFAGGDLWQMPWESYAKLTFGAFDRPKEYAATAPVFFRLMQDIDSPVLRPLEPSREHRAAQLKLPSNAPWALAPWLEPFHELAVERVWAALAVTAPAVRVLAPKLSCTFIVPGDGDVAFDWPNPEQPSNVIHAQGDADHDYLFAPELASAPVSAATLAAAEAFLPRLDQVRESTELTAALETLLATRAPSLSPAEQLVLAVGGLEALLLPEVRSGLKATFARRGSALLAQSEAERAALSNALKTLYDVRSASVHGADLRAELTNEAVRHGHARQLLARAIAEMTTRCRDLNIADVRTGLDDVELGAAEGPTPALSSAAESEVSALLRFKCSVTSQIAGTLPSMATPEGTTGSWAPLLGLRAEESVKLGDGCVISSLKGDELLSLEEREARMDFLAPLNDPILHERLQHACLFTALRNADAGNVAASTSHLLRRRDLGVVALRLAGFVDFVDPELLGSFVYVESTRFRQPTLIRQTVGRKFVIPAAQTLTPDRLRVAQELMALLLQYESQALHPDVEHTLTLYRRSFDRDFLLPATVATLKFSALEAMLGRFRPKGEPLQLEDLVSRVVGEKEAGWFRRQGRRLRNAVMHGRTEDAAAQQAQTELTRLLAALIPEFVRCWLETPRERPSRPGSAFIAKLGAEST